MRIKGIGLLLLAAAFFLVLRNEREAEIAGEQAQYIAIKIRQQMAEADRAQSGGVLNIQTQNHSSPTRIEIDGNGYIGILEIPSLQLSLPVLDTWDMENLKKTPCLYAGSYLENHMVIAGHNYARHFSPIKRLVPGDVVYFLTPDGVKFIYKVQKQEILGPEQIEEMLEEEWNLTLFTCTTGGQKRCAIRCMREI